MNHTIIITENHVNERLDQALAKLLPEYSRSQLKDWIDAGHVLVNKLPVKAKYKVKLDDTISVAPQIKSLPSSWVAEAIDLNIIYEDSELLIINKPVGLVVHPGAGNANATLLNALLHHAPELNELPRAGILHRLDKNTSGLLVVAKTPAALKSLTHQLKQRSMSREYFAIVCGDLISGGEVDAPIGRHPLKRKTMAVSAEGKPARTHYRIAEKFRAHTLLSLKLDTGRTHQIRVHMQYIRHPIVGDPVYGGRIQLPKHATPELTQGLRQFPRQALHAFALGFEHPKTHEAMRWVIDLPEDMQQLLATLRDDTKEFNHGHHQR